MLQQDKPDDYVVATGESHSVREVLDVAFGALDLDWKKYVEIDPRYFRPTEVDHLRGDSGKAQRALGWKPKVTLQAAHRDDGARRRGGRPPVALGARAERVAERSIDGRSSWRSCSARAGRWASRSASGCPRRGSGSRPRRRTRSATSATRRRCARSASGCGRPSSSTPRPTPTSTAPRASPSSRTRSTRPAPRTSRARPPRRARRSFTTRPTSCSTASCRAPTTRAIRRRRRGPTRARRWRATRAVAAATPRHFILRVGCLYGRGGRNFPSTIVRRLRAGETIRADRERLGSPTWVREVAARLRGAGEDVVLRPLPRDRARRDQLGRLRAPVRRSCSACPRSACRGCRPRRCR